MRCAWWPPCRQGGQSSPSCTVAAALRPLGLLLASTAALHGGAAASSSHYARTISYMEGDFFSKWDFWTDADPSHGSVEYVSAEAAKTFGLVRQTEESVFMGVDMTSVLEDGAGRQSVRIQSKEIFNGGLFVLWLTHMPTGCGTWPAFWMYGEDEDHIWPTWGEYDIIEGIHGMKHTMTSLHTGPGCDQSQVKSGQYFSGLWVPANMKQDNGPASNCDIHGEGQAENQGCSQVGPEGTMGDKFNQDGGGTFAAEWDPIAGYFRTWFWRTGTEPGDLQAGQPDPESWGMPYSYYELSQERCDPQNFQNMRIVFDITFCGDFADPFFGMMCPKDAASMTCTEFVAQHPERMYQAYWSILALDVYQHPPGPAPEPEPQPPPPPQPPPQPVGPPPGSMSTPAPGGGRRPPAGSGKRPRPPAVGPMEPTVIFTAAPGAGHVAAGPLRTFLGTPWMTIACFGALTVCALGAGVAAVWKKASAGPSDEGLPLTPGKRRQRTVVYEEAPTIPEEQLWDSRPYSNLQGLHDQEGLEKEFSRWDSRAALLEMGESPSR